MKRMFVSGIVLVAIVIVAFRISRQGPEGELKLDGVVSSAKVVSAPEVTEKTVGNPSLRPDRTEPEKPVVTPEEGMTDDEKREVEAEQAVEAFDAETDRWMDAEKTKPPTMKEVDAFRAMFSKVPKDRKDECIHRALNLIPDENVMLLAGILMDKTEDKEIVETVFNDVLNRDEDVKKPILKQIFADKTHPCWADTAWILDVTGELPAKK